jgi:D-alanyl-lipoteichoic acid acyltransferase DltB (MBOAT superfamily)
VKQIKETLRFSWYSEAKSLKTLGFIDIFVTFFLVFLGFLVFSGFPIFSPESWWEHVPARRI